MENPASNKKVEYTCLADAWNENVEWQLCGPVLNAAILNKKPTINVHVQGPQSIVYHWVSGSIDEGQVVYKHCSDGKLPVPKYGRLCFREVAPKLFQLKMLAVGKTWTVELMHPLSGHCDTVMIDPSKSWKEFMLLVRDTVAVPPNSDLCFFNHRNDVIRVRGNVKVKNVLEVPPSTATKKMRTMLAASDN